MTHIPTEDPYNDKFLGKMEKEHMAGWDCAVESMKQGFSFYKDEIETGSSILDTILRQLADTLLDEVLDYVKGDRQQHVVSFIDDTPDEELEKRGYIPEKED